MFVVVVVMEGGGVIFLFVSFLAAVPVQKIIPRIPITTLFITIPLFLTSTLFIISNSIKLRYYPLTSRLTALHVCLQCMQDSFNVSTIHSPVHAGLF